MFALRRQAQRNIINVARRQFGSDASQGVIPRMEFEEWKVLNQKLQQPNLPAPEKNQIVSRFTEARLSEEKLQEFYERVAIQKMTPEQFEVCKQDILANVRYTRAPLLAEHEIKTIEAYRAGTAAPDHYTPTPYITRTWTKEELGSGNVAQKNLNEYIYEMQNNPKTANLRNGGFDLGSLDSRWIQTQSLIFLFAAVTFGVAGADLYRDIYIEKYNLYDMLAWETRVVCKRAEQERGW